MGCIHADGGSPNRICNQCEDEAILLNKHRKAKAPLTRKDLIREHLETAMQHLNKEIEANDGRLTPRSSNELDFLLEVHEYLKKAIKNFIW